MIISRISYSLRHYAALVGLVLISTGASAQRHDHEKIESVRIALITERLSLTPETAQRFWPVYNQISEARAKLRRKGFQLRRSDNADSLTDEQAREQVDAYFDLKRRELALEEQAVEQYESILSPVQVVQLLKTEQDFHRMMLKQLGRRGRSPGGRDEHP